MRLTLFATMLLCTISTFGQDVLFCGQTEATEKLFAKNPHLRHDAEIAEAELEAFTAARTGGGDEIVYIPVVFHIIHENGPENISDEQVHDAMTVLNRDFRMQNEDIEDVVEAFQDITADIEIEFRLATLDPNGNCTKAINRIQSPLTNEGEENMKALIQWPRDMYLNVWICAYASGAAGYTYTPGSVSNANSASQDGIVLKHDYTGSIGTSSLSRSRTLTHEVGHWLNLRHCWGGTNSPGESENCFSDDNVQDTPNTLGWTSCPLSGESCTTLDNVQNYMEYSYCSRMFTEGQKSRMQSAAASGTADRNELSTVSNLMATGVLDPVYAACTANFTTTEHIVCQGEEIPFTDESFHNIISWSWEFGDGESLEGSDPEIHKNPIHVYNEPGFYAVTLVVSDGETEVSTTEVDFVQVLPSGDLTHPFVEGFEDQASVDEDWFIYNHLNDQAWHTTTQASYSGDKSMILGNFSNNEDDNLDELITSTIDASEMDALVISYKWAYANKWTETNDRFRVRISPDCGRNWYTLDMHTGNTDLPTANNTNAIFYPDADEWASGNIVVTNGNYLTPNTRVNFEFIGLGGNNMFLDDINLIEEGYTTVADNQELLDYLNLFPNPTTDNTKLEFFLRGQANTVLSITDLLGREVVRQDLGQMAPGLHTVDLDTKGYNAGMYVVRLAQGNQIKTIKLLVK
jgi:PKD repeat protein